MWWIYFDVVALVSAKRLGEAEVGRVQNELARDSYSYIHLAMVAGIVLVAFGLKTTIAHADEHLHDVPAFALLGGVAIYLLGLVAFRYRHVHTINRQRLGLAIVLLILVPVATAIPALISLADRRRADLGDDRATSTAATARAATSSATKPPSRTARHARARRRTRIRFRHTPEP